jgi:hypothetical protein
MGEQMKNGKVWGRLVGSSGFSKAVKFLPKAYVQTKIIAKISDNEWHRTVTSKLNCIAQYVESKGCDDRVQYSGSLGLWT